MGKMKLIGEGTAAELAQVLALLSGKPGVSPEATSPTAASPVVASLGTAAVADHQQEKVDRAWEEAFVPLIALWKTGFDPDGRSHWKDDDGIDRPIEDRSTDPRTMKGERLREIGIGPQNGSVLAAVQQTGGLTLAVKRALVWLDGDADDPSSPILPEDQNELARSIAMNITQVSSILFPHLSDLFEHHNPLDRS